jgi:hypothetical protein
MKDEARHRIDQVKIGDTEMRRDGSKFGDPAMELQEASRTPVRAHSEASTSRHQIHSRDGHVLGASWEKRQAMMKEATKEHDEEVVKANA